VKLNTKLATLGWSVAQSENRPTDQMVELFTNLVERVDTQLAALKTITEQDIPAFNKTVSEASVPAVVG
jgi:hypothetical protein